MPPETRATSTWLTRNLLLVSLASLLTDISSEMVYPILPFFLTATLGASPRVLGIIEGVVEAIASLMRVISGRISDSLGKRKPLAIAGYGASVGGKVVLFIAMTPALVLVGRLIDRFGKGIRTAPRDALLAESVPVSERGRAFGFHKAMDTLGAIVGVLAAYLLVRSGDIELRRVIVLSLLPAGLAVLVLAFLKETGSGRATGARAPRRSWRVTWRGLPRKLKLFYLVVFIFALGSSSNQFLLLRAHDLGFAPADAILLYLVYNVSYFVVSYPAGNLSDRIGRRPVLVTGYALYGACYAAFGLVHLVPDTRTALWILFAVYGVYIGLTDGVEKALIADWAPADARATTLGLHASITALGLLPASLIAGVLYTSAGPGVAFGFGGACGIIAAILARFVL
jgi:MFS family permease